MERLRPLPGVLAMLAIALVLPSSAGAARIAAVGAPSVGALESVPPGAASEIAVTVRNDSRKRGRLRVRLVLDDGTIVRLRKKRVEAIIEGKRVALALRRRGRRPLRIERGGVRRVKVQLLAEPMPAAALAGTLVVRLAKAPRVFPLTARISAAPKPEGSRFAKADPQPESVVMVVRRWLPSPLAPRALIVDKQDVAVEGLAAGAALAAGKELAAQALSGDSGGRGTLVLTARDAVAAGAGDAVVTVDAQRLTQYGTYEAKIPLDPAADGSPTLGVKVVTRDLFIWPLLAILLGTALAYRQLRRQEEERPKEVLRAALQRLKELHDVNEGKPGPKPYKLELFPGDLKDCSDPKLEAHKLYCRIAKADLQEDLDDITKEIADIDARVRAWPGARAKVKRLAETREKLPDDDLAETIRAASKKLEKRKPAPASADATTAYLKEVDAQVEAIQAWIDAYEMFEEASDLHATLETAGEPDVETMRTRNPERWKTDLREAEGAEDLERCGAPDGLCRDLHVLRSLSMTQPPEEEEPEELFEESPAADAARTRALRLAIQSGRFGASFEMAPEELRLFSNLVGRAKRRAPASLVGARSRTRVEGPAEHEPVPSVSDRMLDGLKAGDRRDWKWAFGIATLVYFGTIYGDTYGSLLEYVSAFAAGAAGAYATNFKLLPWFRSYRPPKAA